MRGDTQARLDPARTQRPATVTSRHTAIAGLQSRPALAYRGTMHDHHPTAPPALPPTDWVFAYGSLMWDPGFDVAETARARLDGFHRSFCLRSVEHRGRPDQPGLVLGLDPDDRASCAGLALRVPARDHARVMADLRARELVTDAYREALVPLTLEGGRQVQAVTYVMRRDHWQYAGGLAMAEQAEIIARAHGGRGPNADYLFNTARHLAQIGMADDEMNQLSDAVRGLLAAG